MGLTHLVAQSPTFEDGVKKRRSGLSYSDGFEKENF
jgi:hypothetical protein